MIVFMTRRWMANRTSLALTLTLCSVAFSAQAQDARPTAPAQAAQAAPAAAPPPIQPAAATPTADTSAAGPQVTRELPQSATSVPDLLSVTPGGLTAKQVADRALQSSHSVRSKQAELRATNASIRQTTIAFFPTLTLAASYTRLSPASAGFGDGATVGVLNQGPLSVGPCPNGMGNCLLDSQGQSAQAASVSIIFPEDNYALSAQLTIPISDYITKLSYAIDGSRASRESARLAIEAEKLKVASEARILFYSWARSLAQVRVAEKSAERSRALLQDAEAAYTLGTISKADLMRLKALVKASELSLMQAKTGQTLMRSQLGLVMEAKSQESANFALGESVLAAPATNVEGSLPNLVDEAVARRLEIQALERATRATREGAGAARSAGYPRLDAFGDITYANPNSRSFPPAEEWNSSWALGVKATWTVNHAFTGSAASSELEAQAASLEAQRATLRQAVEQEVTAAYLERNTAREAISTAAEAREASQEAYRVAQDLYRVGRATTTELIEAEAELVRALSSELDAQITLHIAEARLWHATGRDRS